MASLVVGGVTIPVAISSPAWTRSDAVDRGRLFDGTFFASESGGATRDWTFSTTPVTQADADTYIAALGSPVAKLCSGDILQIPTMCSPELPSGKPTRAASSNRVILDFMLHEIQPSKVLLRYAPGDTITGETFTRSTTAKYYDSAGVVQSAAINVKRDGHYLGGVRSLLLENSAVNLCLQAEVLGTTWTVSDATIGTNVVNAPDGALTADKIQETATTAVHPVIQNIGGLTDSTVYTFSVFLKPLERTWAALNIQGKDGTSRTAFFNLSGAGAVGTLNNATATILAVGSWYRCTISATVATGGGTPRVLIYPATADTVNSYLGTLNWGVYAWGGQLELGAFATSYIPTTTVSVTRGGDSYSLPFTTPPQEITVYSKFVELGTVQTASAHAWSIGNAAQASPIFVCYAPSGFYRAHHHNGTAAVTSTLGAAPAFRAVDELMCRLFGDGSVDITQSIAGAASTSGAQSSANALGTAWSGLLCWLNAGGSGAQGFAAIQSFKIVAGARSLTEIRAL